MENVQYSYETGDLNFNGVKTNVVGFRYDGPTAGDKNLVKIVLTGSTAFIAGAYFDLMIVPTSPILDADWDNKSAGNYHFRHTWTGSAKAVYSDMIDEDGQRSRFKPAGRLVVDKTVLGSGSTISCSWSFVAPRGGNYALIILAGGYGVNVVKGSVSVHGVL